MLRILVRTPRRRLAWLALIVALAWVVWSALPSRPEASWSLPPGERTNYWFTPDGRTVLTVRRGSESASSGGSAVAQAGRLVGRDAETGRERYRLLGSAKSVGLIELTPSGLATVPADGDQLIVFDPADGRQVAALSGVWFGHDKGRSVMYFSEYINPVSPDGRWLAYRAREGDDLRLHDLIEGHDGPVLPGARPPANFSPDGRTLAALTADRRVGFWDVATGAARPAPADRGPPMKVCGLWFSPDGRTLAAVVEATAPDGLLPPAGGLGVGIPPNFVALWDVASGARRADPPTPGPGQSISGLSFSPDSRFLAAAGDGPSGLWDLTPEPPALVLLAPAAGAPMILRSNPPLLTPDGSGVLAVGAGRELVLLDPATRERRQSFRLRPEAFPLGTSAAFSPDGRTLLVSYQTLSWTGRLPNWTRRWLDKVRAGPRVHIAVGAFDVATGWPLRAVEFAGGPHVTLPAFAPDSRSFWTVTTPASNETNGRVVFERWSVEPPGPPWWLLGLTAAAVGLAVVDRFRRRGVIPPEA
jgi:WD40 repeat protein